MGTIFVHGIAEYRTCDACGVRVPLLTSYGMPRAWLCKSPVPSGWGRVEHGDGVRHYCKSCVKGKAPQ